MTALLDAIWDVVFYALMIAVAAERERAATVALEQRCERGTPSYRREAVTPRERLRKYVDDWFAARDGSWADPHDIEAVLNALDARDLLLREALPFVSSLIGCDVDADGLAARIRAALGKEDGNG